MTETQAERVQIAETILDQLGGGRFKAMTGARNFIALESGLMFGVPGTITKNGINRVCIYLDPSDTYTVKFEKVRRASVRLVNEFSPVYDDQLQSVFESATGLRTRL
jgi:hypothetical protein